METILKETKEFKLLFEKSENLLNGKYSSKIKGDGVEFVDLKEYFAGDDVRKIDWKVTARENKPFIKEFLEEKDSSHYVFLDVSASMSNKFEFAKVLATSLLLSSSKSRDNFSIGFFNKEKIEMFELAKSRNVLMKYVYKISKVEACGEGEMRDLLIRILSNISKKSIISIITDDLEDINDEVKSLLFAVKKKHKLNYFQLFSSNEKYLEIGLNSFEDIETGASGIYDLNEEEIAEYIEEYESQLKNIETDLLKIGIKPFVIDTDLDMLVQLKRKGEVI